MAGKVRVHELAKELGVTARQLLLWISEEGEFARSASSTLPAPVARRLREAHADPSGSRPLAQRGIRGPSAEEPPYHFVRQAEKKTAHHRDYLSGRPDRALCGVEDVAPLAAEESPSEVCTACQDRLPRYEASWWRARCLKTASELKQLRQKCVKLEEQLRNRREPARAQKNAQQKRDGQKPPAKGARGNAGQITQYCVDCKSRKSMQGFDVGRGLCADCRGQSRSNNVSHRGVQAKKAPPAAAGPKSWKCPNCLKRIDVDKKRALVQHQNARGLRCAGSGYQLPERSVDAMDYRVAGSFEGGRR
jgi:hypothetical protein